jgi:hypothetical protein
MSGQLKYEDVEGYLRTFPTEAPPYGFGGLLQLVLAGIEKLRENVVDGDIREHAHFITDEQVVFIQQLLEGRADSIAWFKDDVAHSSQTGLL